MIALALLCLCGLAIGFLLLVRVPLCEAQRDLAVPPCSIIIPARNEAHNLPRLLTSISQGTVQPLEIVVVDDHSTDATATVASQAGARVVEAPPLQAGWTGKTSACFAGAAAARGTLLLFLDADTWFEADGLAKLLQTFLAFEPETTALSVLPFHITSALYEELSLFFNLMMIFGAGGFGAIGRGRLFGQSLLITRSLYEQSGTHQAVSGEILENLALARQIESAGGRCVSKGGRGVLRMRMFPNGAGEMCEGWTKAFANGAAASDKAALAATVLWLTALCTAFLWLLLGSGVGRNMAAAFYVIFVLQIAWFARQAGSFRWYTFTFYPLPLIFFFAIFGRSLKRRLLNQRVTWRGRQL